MANHDVERFQQIVAQDWASGLEEHQLEAAQAAAGCVIDPSAAETTCPACLTTFATGPGECPECGLGLG